MRMLLVLTLALCACHSRRDLDVEVGVDGGLRVALSADPGTELTALSATANGAALPTPRVILGSEGKTFDVASQDAEAVFTMAVAQVPDGPALHVVVHEGGGTFTFDGATMLAPRVPQLRSDISSPLRAGDEILFDWSVSGDVVAVDSTFGHCLFLQARNQTGGEVRVTIPDLGSSDNWMCAPLDAGAVLSDTWDVDFSARAPFSCTGVSACTGAVPTAHLELPLKLQF